MSFEIFDSSFYSFSESDLHDNCNMSISSWPQSSDLQFISSHHTPPYDGSEMSSASDENSQDIASELFSELNDVSLCSVLPTGTSNLNTLTTSTIMPSSSEKVVCKNTTDKQSKPTKTRGKKDARRRATRSKLSQSSSVSICEVVSPHKSRKMLATNASAVIARRNREKKKQYIESLEETITVQKTEIGRLSSEAKSLAENVNSLEKQVTYLQSVLKNQSELAPILNAISTLPDVNFKKGLLACKQTNPCLDHNYPKKLPNKLQNSSDMNHNKETSSLSGGVCVHVSNGCVSLEFCPECSEKHVKPC